VENAAVENVHITHFKDSDRCEAHGGLKIRKGVSEAQRIISAGYSQSQQQRLLQFLENMSENMAACNEEVQWMKYAPPDEVKQENDLLFELAFDPTAGYHIKGKPWMVSSRMGKWKAYFEHANDRGRNLEKRHYCRQPDGMLCCASLEEVKGKMTEREAQCFALNYPAVTGGKMTMYQESLAVGAIAIIKKKVFPRALKFREKNEKFVGRDYNAGNIGADASDFQLLSASRNNNIAVFWDDSRMQHLIVIHFKLNGILEKILRAMMGHKGVTISFGDVAPLFCSYPFLF